MAQLVGVDVGPYVKAVKAAGAQAFVEAITFRQEELPAAVSSGITGIPGGRIVAADLPLGPTRDFAAPLLGKVGEVTAEIIAEHPEYHPGDMAGLSGLQARYDEQLRGTPGVSVDAVPEQGNPRELYRTEATPGDPLVLSLDLGLETKAEELLAGVGPASALVAIRPSTGEILAAANGPGNGGQNLATFGQAAPGSTFKTVSSLALLRAGLTPDTVVPCTPTVTVDGKEFKNYSDYPASALGDIPFRTAVANSCNTAFISQAPKLSGTNLFDAGGLPGHGPRPRPRLPGVLRQDRPGHRERDRGGRAADRAGHHPRLADGDGHRHRVGAAGVTRGAAAGRRGRRLRAGRRGAAVRGRGDRAAVDAAWRGDRRQRPRRCSTCRGAPVIAKTGTAEFGTGDDLQTHAWMIAAQGDLAVCVYVDVGESGSGTAGPILEAFLRAAG